MKCGVSEYDCEALIMGRPWPIRGCCAMERKKLIAVLCRPTYTVNIYFDK